MPAHIEEPHCLQSQRRISSSRWSSSHCNQCSVQRSAYRSGRRRPPRRSCRPSAAAAPQQGGLTAGIFGSTAHSTSAASDQHSEAYLRQHGLAGALPAQPDVRRRGRAKVHQAAVAARLGGQEHIVRQEGELMHLRERESVSTSTGSSNSTSSSTSIIITMLWPPLAAIY